MITMSQFSYLNDLNSTPLVSIIFDTGSPSDACVAAAAEGLQVVL